MKIYGFLCYRRGRETWDYFAAASMHAAEDLCLKFDSELSFAPVILDRKVMTLRPAAIEFEGPPGQKILADAAVEYGTLLFIPTGKGSPYIRRCVARTLADGSVECLVKNRKIIVTFI